MVGEEINHQLLILSRDYETYQQLIEREGFRALSIVATNDIDTAVKLGGDSDLLFGEPSLISRIVNRLPRLIWAQSTWAGVEPLLQNGLRQDYQLTNARNVYGGMMSEYVFGYLLFIERKILSRWQNQQNGKWDARPHGTLKGKTIGLVGVGTIGCHLAQTAHHFGMIVYGYTRTSENCMEVDWYFHGNNTNNFAKDLDYLVCSLPGTLTTKEFINREFLSYLPKRAWIVNIGRGSTIHEPSLADALNTGEIAGAVLDVFAQEPLPENNPLWKTPNTFITSHTAAVNYPPDIAQQFIENYKLFIENQPLKYQVDFYQQY